MDVGDKREELTTASVQPTLVRVGSKGKLTEAEEANLAAQVAPWVRFHLLDDLLNAARANSLWPLSLFPKPTT